MKLSTRSRYGARLMLDLALHYERGPVRLAEIARRQGISVKYLEQIVMPLKKAKYLKSIRGPRGGHMLARPPAEITVGEIVNLMEGGLLLTRCAEFPGQCERSETCFTRYLWKETTEIIHQRLNSITLADLMNRNMDPKPAEDSYCIQARSQPTGDRDESRLPCREPKEGNQEDLCR